MTEPRERAKKANVEAGEVVMESPEGAQEQVEPVVESAEEQPEEQTARPLDEVLGQAERAYAA